MILTKIKLAVAAVVLAVGIRFKAFMKASTSRYNSFKSTG